jgi:hypothetical protein
VSRPEQAVGVQCGCIVCFVRNDGALMAVKKLCIRLCAARDTGKGGNSMVFLSNVPFVDCR